VINVYEVAMRVRHDSDVPSKPSAKCSTGYIALYFVKSFYSWKFDLE
jgi:hypothetical protein